jgi:hypothetical protein
MAEPGCSGLVLSAVCSCCVPGAQCRVPGGDHSTQHRHAAPNIEYPVTQHYHSQHNPLVVFAWLRLT